MKKLSALCFCLILFGCCFSLMAQARQGDLSPSMRDRSTLDFWLSELEDKNPEIKSLAREVLAAKDRRTASGYPDDPRLSFEAMDVPTSDATTPMGGYRFTLKQMLPFPSKLATRHAVAKSRQDQKQQEALEKINQLRAKFKVVYFDYALVSESIAIHERNQRRLESMANILESKYAAGHGLQQDILKTKLEIQKIREQLTHLRHLKKIRQARLNALLTRPVDAEIPLRFSYSYLRPLRQSLPELLTHAQAERPWLKRSGSMLEESQKKLSLAKQSLLPDFDFMLGYTADGMMPATGMREDSVSAGVEINVPFLWTLPARQKKISAAKNERIAMELERQAMGEEVKYQVSEKFHMAIERREQVFLYVSKILPQSQAALESARVAYEAGEVDYLNLIMSQIMLYENELMDAQNRYAYAKAVAELEMAVGRSLE